MRLAPTLHNWYGGWYPSDSDDYSSYSQPDPPTYKPDASSRPLPLESLDREGLGLVLGRFDPLHRGHEFLIRYAREMTSRCVVALRASGQDSVPSALRESWLEELFPHLERICLEGKGRLWQRKAIKSLGKISVLFTSQNGPEVAELVEKLQCQHVCLDLERASLPIRATQIRSHPFSHWRYLPDCVRAHYVQRVALVGPESTGKTTLARKLAHEYQTPWVQEQARRIAALAGGRLALQDMVAVARAQRAAEQALRRSSERLLVCDTEQLNLAQWSQRLFESVPAELEEQCRLPHDLYLLCEPRSDHASSEAVVFFQTLKQRLEREGRRFCVLSGDLESEMLPRARQAIETLLIEPRLESPPSPACDGAE